MTPPHDLDAEHALVGSVVMWPTIIDGVAEYVLEEDFYDLKSRAIYGAALRLHRGGERIDSVTVVDECKRVGGSVTSSDVVRVVSGEGGRQWRRYADIVLGASLRRRLIAESAELANAAQDVGASPVDTLEKHRASIASIDTALVTRDPDDMSVEEFLERPSPEQTPWVVHGLIRRGWRVMVVGPEGAGKSFLLRQLGQLAAYGVHPLRFTPIPKVRVLTIDLENPEDALYASFDRLLRRVQRETDDRETVNRFWWRPGGIDLRKRADRAELDALIAKRRPDLVILGPLYKAYNVNAQEGFELPAREVQHALDDLRARYGFALVMEDHAPQASGGARREIRPYGSSFWLRWPEIGIGLSPAISDPNELILNRWRGDRAPVDWPDSVTRGSAWPWEGVWRSKGDF